MLRVKRKQSLKFKVWQYFMFFTAIVFILLWFFQIVFLENFYEGMKIKDVKSTAARIARNYGDENYSAMLTDIALNNDLCIEITDKYNRTIYTKDVMGRSCLIHGPNDMTFSFIQKLKESSKNTLYFKEFSNRLNSNILIMVTTIGDKENPKGYLIINTPLAPVGSTASIIKKQLVIITFYLVLIGLILSFFMSKKISDPIVQITRSAKKLAEGDYTTKFDGGNYDEIQQLANTLTYAGQEISKVDAMQRDLIANVSHDLRTPLTMLKAYAEMIRDLSGDNPQKRNQHLEIIIDETDRLALLVNDMLDLSKLEDGNQKLNYSEFDITEVMDGIIARFKGISKQSDYHINFTPDESITVKCDIIKIQQVIYNLINNAINYTGSDKQIFVRQINKENCVRIEIEDTGEGIPKDKINLIFDKYYRSENHKRTVVGTGLGLSIVKAILKKHGYNFGVYSSEGQGSTFWFEISDIVCENESKNDETVTKR